MGSHQKGREDLTDKKRNLGFQRLSARPIGANAYMNCTENKEIFHNLKLRHEAQKKLIHPCNKLQIATQKVINLNKSMNSKDTFL